MPDGQRPAYVNDLVTRLRSKRLGSGGRWVADHVRLRFQALKPGAPGKAAE